MIHVCYGIYDKNGRYSKFAGTSILSMFENTQSKVTVHILHDNTLTQDNRDKFIYIAGQYNQTIKFYNVEESCADKIAEMRRLIPAIENARVSIGTLYSLLVRYVIPDSVSKIIYIDCDTIINLNIDEFYKIELGNKSVSSIPEHEADPIGFEEVSQRHYLIKNNMVKYEDYFNAGVIFMNLERLRNEENKIYEGIKWRAEHLECICFDQDIWNYCYGNDYLKLPAKFDQFVMRAVERVSPEKYPTPRKVIYHYTGQDPQMNFNDMLSRLYWSYFAKTPWFNAEMIGRMYEGVRQIYAEQKGMMISLSAIMSGKTRAFFMLPNDIENMKKFFRIKSNEEIIPASGSESLNKLAESMRKSEGKKLYILLLPMYPYCREFLTKAGFEEGKDFINGFVFLSDAQGVPLNAYQIIKLM